MARVVGASVLALALAVQGADVPKTCALYFDFHTSKSPSQLSHLYFGEVAEDGTFEKGQRGDLGLHNDPQGFVTIAEDGKSLAFLTHDNSTNKEAFGCCDQTAVMTVDIASGKADLKALHRTAGVAGASCGLWGCGFLEIGQLVGSTILAWVEPLLPPPPPPGSEDAAAVEKRPITDFGMSLATFDVKTGDAQQMAPFALHQANQSAAQLTGGGTTDFSDNAIYFACNPHSSDIDVEAICYTPTAASSTPAEQFLQWYEFENKAYTITSVAYSRALEAPVAIAQNIADDANMTSTKVYVASGKDFGKKELVDLGASLGSLHQATISADGKFLMVYLSAGNSDYPKEFILTVDLINKKVVKKIAVKDHSLTGIAVLTPVAC